MVALLSDVPPALAAARAEIDAIDTRLIALLKERFAVVEKVVAIKAEHGLPALLEDRVEEVVAHVRGRAVEAGVPPDAAEAVWRALIGATIDYENAHLPGPQG